MEWTTTHFPILQEDPDHMVRPEENLAGIVSYIIENPVRAGLVISPFDSSDQILDPANR